MPPGSCDRENSITHAVIPGDWQQQPQPQGMAPLHHKGSAREIREYLVEFFNSTAVVFLGKKHGLVHLPPN